MADWVTMLIAKLFLQEMLTRHKMLAAEFLEANFDKVFSHYQKLLHSDNYVTKRQSLKLLGELLLDRHNFTVSFLLSCLMYLH
jgi:DNA-binding SARP family transcriptional activator